MTALERAFLDTLDGSLPCDKPFYNATLTHPLWDIETWVNFINAVKEHIHIDNVYWNTRQQLTWNEDKKELWWKFLQKVDKYGIGLYD